MATPLEKARLDPTSMKARILSSARLLFGRYGFNGTPTRAIAKAVGIDISTLYYHWGEKQDLYEAVILEIHAEILSKFREIEALAGGRPLAARLEIAIEVMCDYLFSHPEVANLFLFGYFRPGQRQEVLGLKVTEYIGHIAIAMGLASDKKKVSVQAKARIMAAWNAVLNFISGERFFRPLLELDRGPYVSTVKETLNFLLVPAFTAEKRPHRTGRPR